MGKNHCKKKLGEERMMASLSARSRELQASQSDVKARDEEISSQSSMVSSLESKVAELEATLTELTEQYKAAVDAKVKCQEEADVTAATISLANRLVNVETKKRLKSCKSPRRTASPICSNCIK